MSDFKSNIKRDRAGRFANKPTDEATGGTDALVATRGTR